MKIKKIAALVLALIMLLSLSGCGMDLKLTTAVLKLNKVQSLHADVDGALELTATDPSSSETFLASVVGGVDFSKEPLSAYADLNLAVMDEQLHILATLESQGDNAVLSYSLDDGATWETQDLGQLEGNMDLDPIDLLEGLGEAGDAIGNFTAVGTETVLGSDATRYDSVISGAVMAELMEENGAEDALENNLGVDVDFDFSNLPDVNLSVWVDKASGLPVKGCIDMSAMLQSMMDASLASILQAAGETGPISDYSLVVNQTYLSVTLSNFNNAGGVSDAREPNAGSLFGSAAGQSPLQIGSRWHGTMELSGHSGKGDLENGIAEVWGYLDTSGDRTYFEIYDFDIDLAPEGTELVPILSYWAEIDGNRELLTRLEMIRGKAAVLLGLCEKSDEAALVTPGIPKLAIMSEPQDFTSTSGQLIKKTDMDITGRMMSMQKTHQAYALTGSMCTAASAMIPGTITNLLLGRVPENRRVRIAHPGGVLEVGVDYTADSNSRVKIIETYGFRTAKLLMSGITYYRHPGETD